ncbi:MAG TPA: two-component regulator propeller domain-containing protein, partial [Terriglobales bacterium]|nr:two-component regulator propeller domain-containing protein [Terriglobales bacterium]
MNGMAISAKAHGRRGLVIAWCVLLVGCCSAFALDPSLDVSQYAHTAWKTREGFSKGNMLSIAQTPDGYLWISTELGTLLRFDGVRTVPWRPPIPKHLTGGIHTTRDGALWIGSEGGLASWKNGVLTQYKEFEGYRISAITEDREGTVWVGIGWDPGGRVCSVRGGKVQCYGADGSLGRYVTSFCDDGDLLWVYAETGLWQWKPAPMRMSQVQKPEGWHLSHMACVNDQGHLLIGIPEGIQQVVNGKILPNPFPNLPKLSDTTSMLRDRDGGLWIGTASHGLVHMHQGRTDRFTRSDGLSGDHVIALLEDREGNLWVLTRDGLDRFREFAIPTISASQGLSTSRVWSVLGARDGSVWVGSNDALHRLSNGQITVYPKGHGLGDYPESLFEDDRGRIWISTSRGLTYFSNGRFTPFNEQIRGQVHSISEDSGGRLWFSEDFEGRQSIGSLASGGVIERIPRSRLGLEESTIILSADSLRGGLWIGAKDGLAYFKDGLIQKMYSSTDGLPPGDVNDIYLDGEGTVWAGTENGLVRLRDGRLATLTTRNGLPCNHVSWVREDDDHSLWLLLQCGLARIQRSELEAWAADTNRTIAATIFDNPDGVQVRWSPSYGYEPVVTKSKDGRLWFTNWDGVSVIDPRRLLRNELPPPVHIEQIAANGKVYWQNLNGAASSKLQLPPRIRDLEIEFTALRLALPEKIRFRYKLEGQDPDWKEVKNDRKVQYSNLTPGNYRFRVMAANNSGVWNEEGAALDFAVDPAYWQTNWFRALCAATFMGLLWMLYQLRVRQLAHQFDMTVEARVGERTRIAR